MSELRQMISRLTAFRAERDWERFHDPKDQIVSLALEAAEVLELTQWHNGEALRRHLDEHREHLGDELIDVLAWVLLIANDRGIDLSEAFERKLAKNAAKYPVDLSRGQSTKYDRLHSDPQAPRTE